MTPCLYLNFQSFRSRINYLIVLFFLNACAEKPNQQEAFIPSLPIKPETNTILIIPSTGCKGVFYSLLNDVKQKPTKNTQVFVGFASVRELQMYQLSKDVVVVDNGAEKMFKAKIVTPLLAKRKNKNSWEIVLIDGNNIDSVKSVAFSN